MSFKKVRLDWSSTETESKMKKSPVTTSDIRKHKTRGEKLVMCTAYDATFASILDTAGIDILLVGDSLGMVIQGHETTIPVTLEHMVYHTRAVTRGAKRAHVVGDMPFMSYKVSAEQALESAMRMMQEGRAHSVKLEGGKELAPTIERIVAAGIPVMGHVGLTPQSVHAMGGFKIQGRNSEGAAQILEDALALQEAGCFAVVLEGIPLDLAKEITSQLEIPTIGIGAGVHCDGQVLVCYDMLGMNEGFKPKFLKEYASLHEVMVGAAQSYAEEVRAGTFPDDEHSFKSKKLRLVEGEESKLYGTTA
jgi:3-methyl-2-oxobutanoate hydroxymethyltransferase